ncbi:MAG: phosphoesterase, partial [Alphaproteobacteria bacterium]|nr:phosphoesterase [Alphaproteobacteria bacterium]
TFLRKLIDKVQSNQALWAKTAILVTVDEGGGYWDSGYIQIIDAFGDGTRIPLIAVSPFARKGLIDHTYTDHASILKFIEANWRLGPLSQRSRDQLPNPDPDPADPYLPTNRPAIGDLTSLFQF